MAAITQSVNLIKTFDYEPIEQRVSLFVSLLNYLCTLIENKPLIDDCLADLESSIRSVILKNAAFSKKDRFNPPFIVTLLLYYDLCKIFNCLEPFKELLYLLFSRAGAFPLHAVYLLWKHDRDVFIEMSLYDSIINCIIGSTLKEDVEELQPFNDLVEYFQSLNVNWEEKLVQIETSSLQCIANHEAFTMENLNLFTIAGKSLSLIYVYRGGMYAVQSLTENKIIESIESQMLDEKYRLFLTYIIRGLIQNDYDL